MILDENLNCIIVYDVEAKRDMKIHRELELSSYLVYGQRKRRGVSCRLG